MRDAMQDICIICEGQGTDRFKVQRVYRIAATALATAARQGGDVEQAPGKAPQSGGEAATPERNPR